MGNLGRRRMVIGGCIEEAGRGMGGGIMTKMG